MLGHVEPGTHEAELRQMKVLVARCALITWYRATLYVPLTKIKNNRAKHENASKSCHCFECLQLQIECAQPCAISGPAIVCFLTDDHSLLQIL